MGSSLSPDVRPLGSNADEVAWIQEVVRENFGDDGSLEVLEAGCGRAWYLDLDPFELRITGIDLNEDALAHRAEVVGDLQRAIHGDLRTIELPPGSYDLAYSAYVLEHVVGVQTVFENLIQWTRPGGLIVLRMPDRETVFGALARSTPYRTHIWFYRYVLRIKDAGREGRAPFPTVYEPEMSRGAIADYFSRRGCQVVGECVTVPFMGHNTQFWRLVRAVMRAAGAITFGRLSGRHTNFTMIIRREH